MPYQVGSSAQRIRIGLTGLAFAFLLVLLGSIISKSSRDEASNAAVPNTAKDLNDSFEKIFICTGSWKNQKHAAMRRLREQRVEFVKCGLFVHTNNRLRRIIRIYGLFMRRHHIDRSQTKLPIQR